MKQINTGTPSGLPDVRPNPCIMKNESHLSGMLSGTKTALSIALMFSLQLLTGKTNAQISISPTTWTGNTTSTNPSAFTSLPANATPGSSAVSISQWRLDPSGTPPLAMTTGASWIAHGFTTGTTLAGAEANFSDVQFTITNNSTTELKVTALSIASQVSSSGPQKVQVVATTPSGSSNFGSTISTAHNGNPETWNITAASPIYICAGQTATFSVYGYAGTGSTGTLRILNNTSVTASYVTAVSASPVNNTPVTLGSSVDFTGTMYSGSLTATYAWSGPLGFTSTMGVPAAFTPTTTAASGVYSVVATDTWGCTSLGLTTVSVTTACTGTPSFAAVASPAIACDNGSSVISLTGLSGTGFTYDWQQSTDGGITWTSTGGTGATYTTSVIAAPQTVLYQASVTCTSMGGGSAASASATFSVNSTPSAGTITGPSYVAPGTTVSLTDMTPGGAWSNFNPALTSVDGTGDVTANLAITGIDSIYYSVTTGGCTGVAKFPISVMENIAGTLATYTDSGSLNNGSGSGDGTGRHVDPNQLYETVGSLIDTALSAGSCGTGGLSRAEGTSFPSYSPTGAHVYYVLTPDAGKALMMTRFGWITRESGTGPDSVRLAYKIDGGPWIAESAPHAITSKSGSCGAHSNTSIWTLSAPVFALSQLQVAIFPLHATGTGSGAFQINETFVDGVVTNSVCTTPVSGTVVTPTLTTACTSGYVSLTSIPTDAAPGMTYQWQSDTSGVFANIDGQNNIYYVSSVYTPTATITYDYRLVSTCATATATTTTATLIVGPRPGAIQLMGGSMLPDHIYPGDTIRLQVASGSSPDGQWTSQHFSVADVDTTTGVTNPKFWGIIKGFTRIFYTVPGFGCYSEDSMIVYDSSSLAAYTGKFNGKTVTAINTDVLVDTLVDSGFGHVTPCGEGGLSGLTIPVTTTGFGAHNAHVYFKMKPSVAGTSLGMMALDATTRSSAQGATMITLAYSLDGGANWVNGPTVNAEVGESCGVDTVAHTWILPSTVAVTDSVLIGIYPSDPLMESGTFQLNAYNVVGVNCAANTAILCNNGSNDNPLDGEIYNQGCTDGLGEDFTLSCTPTGGTWSSSNTGVATVDPTTGAMGLNAGAPDGPVTITYTNLCGVSTQATFSVSADAGCGGDMRPAHTASVATVNTGKDVTIYPNPASTMLNISAAEVVNIAILSMDGKTLIERSKAQSVNIAALPSGLYMIKVYNAANNTLIKTAKFTKE